MTLRGARSSSGPDGSGGRPALAGRPKLTSRAAVLAIVLCAIALSLAYPIREYIAERRQIDQLQAQNAAIAAQVQYLKSQQRSLTSPARIEQEARDNLHMCFLHQTCYEVITPTQPHPGSAVRPTVTSWYERLWESVRKADGAPAR
ncbi:MAG TPA: septum formation initiator family protein [Streptosporangiaceae bacterium]|nr:septum formation initiator family protein [Streptosporangiaceae bacterium]